MAGSRGDYDVLVLGGGLAGLTLALQLKLADDGIRVAVAEKRPGPAPEAAFKVGESTAEPSAHYFREVLKLRQHLRSDQVRKAGLRFFFAAGDNTDITERVEFGSAFFPPLATYQLDRGRLENVLAERCREAGVDLHQGAFVDAIELGGERHAATVVRGGPGGERSSLEGRWLVDASGRASLLKRELNLARDVDHTINAAWFRLGQTIAVDEWSDDPTWRGRVETPDLRSFSTNHLADAGYWIWMIQLSSGPISIGIVADPRYHPFESFNTFEKALEWFTRHEPQLAAAVAERRDSVQDFLTVEDFAYGAQRVFSADRWALTGEAGVFADPLYSPGSDFIAIGNTLITDLVRRDLAGEPIAERAERHNEFYLDRLFDTFLSYYTDQYQFYGNPQVMVAKVVFDQIAYWGNFTQVYIRDKLVDLDFMAAIEPETDRMCRLIKRFQNFLREWHTLIGAADWRRLAIGTYTTAIFAEVYGDLATPLDDEGLKAKIAQNAERLEAYAVAVFAKAASQLPDAPSLDEREINPYAIGLRPERWEADGLFDPPGMTVSRARELAPGLDQVFLDELAGAGV